MATAATVCRKAAVGASASGRGGEWERQKPALYGHQSGSMVTARVSARALRGQPHLLIDIAAGPVHLAVLERPLVH